MRFFFNPVLLNPSRGLGRPSIVKEGLVLNLDMAESYPGSGVDLFDRSGRGNNASMTNAVFTSELGGGISFDGNGDSVDVEENFGMTPQVLTLEIAFKRVSNTNTTGGSAPSTIQYLAFRQNVLTNAFEGYALNINETPNNVNIGFATASGIQSGIATPNNSVPLGEVVHAAFTVADTVITAFVNGVQTGTGAKQPGISYRNDHRLKLGRTLAVGQAWDAHFNGIIYLFRLYNRVLTAADVKRNFSASRRRLGI
jgi:hypothetical protein